MKVSTPRSIRVLLPLLGCIVAACSAVPANAEPILGIQTVDPSLPPSQCVTPSVCFYLFEGFKRYLVPIPGDGVLQVDLVKVLHFGFINIVRTPMGANEQETFDSQMFVDASINGGAIQRISQQGSVTTLVSGKVGNVTGTFNTEMLALNMTSSSSVLS